MQYVNFVYGADDDAVLHTAPVADDDAAYLRRATRYFRALSDDDYMNGPAIVLHTLAKSSYVLDGEELFWLIEWDPGLIVVRFSPGGEIVWTAIRSPVPDFGGREAKPAEWDDYDEDADNPQYNLIFVPWDAQFDADKREWNSFVPADSKVQSRFENALSRVNELGEVMEERFAANRNEWAKRCKQNLETWCGEGVRLE